jgi:two-component system, NarL family, response regulator NreC
MDWLMPGMNGLDAVHSIRKFNSQAEFIMISMEMNEDLIRLACEAGVKGFLSKNSFEPELLDAIREVMKGNTYITGRFENIPGQLTPNARKAPETKYSKFTPRERDIIRLIVKGYTSSQIAEQLNLSKRTIDNNRVRILAKSGTESIAGLVRFAMNTNLAGNNDIAQPGLN